MYLIVYTVAYSVYLPPMGRSRSVKKILPAAASPPLPHVGGLTPLM